MLTLRPVYSYQRVRQLAGSFSLMLIEEIEAESVEPYDEGLGWVLGRDSRGRAARSPEML